MSIRVLILLAGMVGGPLWAANATFVGDWKLNPAKSVLTDVMKVESLGGNRYSFDFGAGTAEKITVDGTDQPGNFGTTFAVTAVAPDEWRAVRKKDGRTIITGIWTLSKDGNTLHDDYSGIAGKGATVHLVYVYKRKGGGSGFAGKWVSTSEQMDKVYEINVRPYQGDGLSFISPIEQLTRNVKFDGREYPNEGPDAAGSTTSARLVERGALEMTDKMNGKVLDQQTVEVSSDGKTLTVTVHVAGREEPNVLVFERE